MRLDLAALLRAQASLRDREIGDLRRHDDGAERSGRVAVGELGEPQDFLAHLGRHQRRLVGRGDHFPGAFEEGDPLGELRGDLLLAPALPRRALPHLRRAGKDRLVDARPDQRGDPRRQLPRLDEHLLADADLAEVVQHGGVAQLAELVAADADGGEGPGIRAVDELREPAGEQRDALRVAGRRRVALLDRGDRRLDEPVEEALDALREPPVLDRHRRLRGERPRDLFVVRVERDDLHAHEGGDRAVRDRPPLAVQELEHADGVSARCLHRHRQHGSAAVSVFRVEPGIEPVGAPGGMAETSGRFKGWPVRATNPAIDASSSGRDRSTKSKRTESFCALTKRRTGASPSPARRRGRGCPRPRRSGRARGRGSSRGAGRGRAPRRGRRRRRRARGSPRTGSRASAGRASRSPSPRARERGSGPRARGDAEADSTEGKRKRAPTRRGRGRPARRRRRARARRCGPRPPPRRRGAVRRAPPRGSGRRGRRRPRRRAASSWAETAAPPRARRAERNEAPGRVAVKRRPAENRSVVREARGNYRLRARRVSGAPTSGPAEPLLLRRGEVLAQLVDRLGRQHAARRSPPRPAQARPASSDRQVRAALVSEGEADVVHGRDSVLAALARRQRRAG